MKLSFNLRSAAQKVSGAILTAFNKIIRKKLPDIKVNIADELFEILQSSDMYEELTQGHVLRGALGIPRGMEEEWITKIHKAVAESLEVKLKDFVMRGDVISGELIITILPDVYTELLDMPDSAYETENGDVLYWLEWLLFEGSNPVVLGYRVQYLTDVGRSGVAVMRRKGNFSIIPAEFQGTEQDNWITRAFQKDSARISRAIKKAINV